MISLESDQDGLMFSGEPLDDETKRIIKKASLQNSITIAKINAAKKIHTKEIQKIKEVIHWIFVKNKLTKEKIWYG